MWLHVNGQSAAWLLPLVDPCAPGPPTTAHPLQYGSAVSHKPLTCGTRSPRCSCPTRFQQRNLHRTECCCISSWHFMGDGHRFTSNHAPSKWGAASAAAAAAAAAQKYTKTATKPHQLSCLGTAGQAWERDMYVGEGKWSLGNASTHSIGTLHRFAVASLARVRAHFS